MNNPNWYQDKDGWHKKPQSTTRGNASYFTRPEPIVRDNQGRPLAKDRQSIDIERWIQEVNEREQSHG